MINSTLRTLNPGSRRRHRVKAALRLFSLAAVMAVSATAGALAQAHWSRPATLSAAQEDALSEQLLRNAALIRENVNLLASRMGEMQASVIAMTGLGKRVAEVSGVSYSDPEIHALMEHEPGGLDLVGYAAPTFSAEELGRELDLLQRRISVQQDWLAMVDSALSRRAGVEARLPTYTPVDRPLESSSFGWRRNPVTQRHTMHEGLDFPAAKGTPIRAASGGVVKVAHYRRGYGKMVELDHGNGLVTRYAHASVLNVKEGDVVEKGQVIGEVGSTGRSTGSHLHFEVRVAGQALDPNLFLAKSESSGAAEPALPQVR